MQTVLNWLRWWNDSGPEGLKDKQREGRPNILTETERKAMLDWILETVEAGECLTCNQIAHWVSENFDKQISDESQRRILHREGYSYKKRSVCDHRADLQEQERFRRELEERMQNESDKRFFFAMKSFFN